MKRLRSYRIHLSTVASAQGTISLKSKDCTNSEEEEESNGEGDQEAEEEEEEIKQSETKPFKAEEKHGQKIKATQKRTVGMKKEERIIVFPKGRRVKKEVQAVVAKQIVVFAASLDVRLMLCPL